MSERRTALQAKESTALSDTLTAELRWHFLPGPAAIDRQNGVISTTQKNRTLCLQSAHPQRLDIRLVKGQKNPIAGWWAPATAGERYEDLPAHEAIVAQRSPLPLAFATMITKQPKQGRRPQLVSSELDGSASGKIIIKRADGKSGHVAIPPSGSSNPQPTSSCCGFPNACTC